MDIDFYARIVRTGTVLGAHAGLQPDRLEEILGDSYETENGDELIWDYGLVSFYWTSQGTEYQGDRFVVNTHWLAEPLPFKELAAAVTLVSHRGPILGFVEYVHRSSGVVVIVRDEVVEQIVSTYIGPALEIAPVRLPAVYSDPEFFASIVESGTVLGVDADLDPAVVARVLGEYDYLNENSGTF